MSGFQKGIVAIGRICFSLIFIFAGINKILNWDGSEQYLVNGMLDLLSHTYDKAWAQTLFDQLLPLATTLLVIAAAIEIIGGLMILLGIWVRLGAFSICLFLIPVTLVFHSFWWLEGADKQLQTIMFLKNLSIFGGALILLALGKGKRKKIE